MNLKRIRMLHEVITVENRTYFSRLYIMGYTSKRSEINEQYGTN